MNFSKYYFIEMPYFQNNDGTYIDLKAEDNDDEWINRFLNVWKQLESREEQIATLKSFGMTIFVFIDIIKRLKNLFLKRKILSAFPKDMIANDFQFMKNLGDTKE